MKKISVFLRVSKKSHPLYEELWKYPPKSVRYFGTKNIVHYATKETFKRNIRNFIWRSFTRCFPATVPIKTDCDLIHSTNNIIPISKVPWIIDVESGHSLYGFNYKKQKEKYYNILLKIILNQKSFKKIIAWSEICKEELIGNFGKELEDRIDVVYPACHIPKKISKKRRNETIKIIFVSRRFEDKGGYEIIDAFNLIKDKYNIELTLISDIPKSIYKIYSREKRIKLIRANLNRKQVSKYLSESDIFVYPTRIDSFGFVIIEAMAHKLPVITNKVYAIPEIIKNGKSGILIDPIIELTYNKNKSKWKNDYDYLKEYKRVYLKNKNEYIKELAEKIGFLIENKKIREIIGKNGFNLIKNGKFSIKERNKKLRKIYEEAIE